MKHIRPTTITEAMLTDCNVPETDYASWAVGTAYTVGTRCIYSHKIYECLVDNTGYQPSGFPAKWLDCGFDNRWKMLDAVVGSQTTQDDSISATIVPGVIDSIALLDMDAVSVTVTMTDPVEGVVYSESIDLVDKTFIVDAYTYFFEPIITNDTVVLLGVPAYANASITITISNPDGVAKIGTMIVGTKKDLGGTQYNPTISITDYSKKDVDTFGNYTVVQRAYSKRMSCQIWIDNSQVDDITRTLAGYRTTPLVWVGTDDGTFSAMIIYGFYKSFSIAIPYPDYSVCSLEIEGLS